MLDELFNSKTRVAVLRVLFDAPHTPRYVQELVRMTSIDASNVFRELEKLHRLHILTDHKQGNRKYFSLNPRSPHLDGLKRLFMSPGAADTSGMAAMPRFVPSLNGISDELRKRVMDREWYHQRFDGCPLFIGEIAEAEVRAEKRKPAGTEAGVRVCFFQNGGADWFLDMADVRRGAQALIALAKKDPAISKKLRAAWKRDEEAFERLFREFPESLTGLSDDGLIDLWNRFWSAALNRFTSSSIIDHFALGTDETVRTMLRRDVYATPAGKKLTKKQFTELFSTATAPVHLSFINQAEIELLKIALGKSRETVEQYQQRWYWISNNYIRAAILPVAHFEQEINTWRTSHKDLAHELKKIERTPRVSSANKQALFKRFRLSPLLRTLITISEDFSWWQDERKRATYLTIHIGTTLLREIAKRKKYDVEDLKYAVASEVEGIITRQSPAPVVLRERRKSCAYVATADGFWFETGAKATQLRRDMLGDETMQDVQDIRGLTACLGRAVGPVKIVQSATEIAKVQPGDVLVAVMTRPDYVPAMRKAAAVVTNEGGITSHAAIVSRELGIPCIIGTKIATRVFKDGDLVEVNANHGWVRKINQ